MTSCITFMISGSMSWCKFIKLCNIWWCLLQSTRVCYFWKQLLTSFGSWGKLVILMIFPNVYTQSNEGFKDLSMRKIFPTICFFYRSIIFYYDEAWLQNNGAHRVDNVKFKHVTMSSYDMKFAHTKEGLAWKKHKKKETRQRINSLQP